MGVRQSRIEKRGLDPGAQNPAFGRSTGVLGELNRDRRRRFPGAPYHSADRVEDQILRRLNFLLGKIPIIYSSQKYKTLAYIWKIKFNENSKIPAFWNYFPELNHNEMVGYTNPNKILHILILKDRDDHPKIIKRMGLTAELLKKKSVKVEFIEIAGKNIWEKILNNLILADWTSYYLAILKSADPTPVLMVEEFKKKLK